MIRRAVTAAIGAAAGLAALASAVPVLAQALPQFDGGVHVGTAACGRSGCHGSAKREPKSTVLNNETITWREKDKHAQAYKVLLNDRSKRIARNLGLAQPAHESEQCLDCHADNVAADKRGKLFELQDGVGCEACHGSGGKDWYGPHQDLGLPTAQLAAKGMYPTHDPLARAKLCVSCHFGTERKTKFVTHRIMGAGHPRMKFELAWFTQTQPAHYAADDDYRRRKGAVTGLQVWAVGQALMLAEMLEVAADKARNHDGRYPELVLFDCEACHHPIDRETDLRWQARRGTGLPPGVPRFVDANLVMLKAVAARVDPGLARELQDRGAALHQAIAKGSEDMERAARALHAVVRGLPERLARHRFTADDAKAMLAALAAEARAGEAADHAAAEQAAWAAGALIDTLQSAGALGGEALAAARRAVDRAVGATKNPATYRPADALAALEEAARHVR